MNNNKEQTDQQRLDSGIDMEIAASVNAMEQMKISGLLVDVSLTEEAMNHLWDIINNSSKQTNARSDLVGQISKSIFIQDKDNILYEDVLKQWSEYLFLSEWKNYYDVHITKTTLPPEFELSDLWVNYQKQHEFNPPHNHRGLFSFVIFMKIPTHWKEQYALPHSVNTRHPCASDFQFIMGPPNGRLQPIHIPLSPEDEGRMLFFPSWVTHQVFPFYECEEERITVSGNIFFPVGTPGQK